ncbi:MAG: thioredoxin domain-containing protein [Acidobacteria bacterium]|nr:thioredoxin domain-containing protein [Acidobacteriota bacterium]
MTAPEESIVWVDWSDEPFARAAAEDKPVLLAIHAPWCHWCHVMDATSYADPGIVAIVNQRFVAIRVDSDRRPDINERYNLGGWPTTAFLTPAGDLLGGGTYFSRERLEVALVQVADAFASRRLEIEANRQRAAAARDADPSRAVRGSEPDWGAVDLLRARLSEEFDETYGGFGVEPKFPHAAALGFALECYLDAPDAHLRHLSTVTLDAMASGGLWDRIEGGFFRYSTARDWSLPHFEKVLEDNAALLSVYLDAWRALGEAGYREIAIELIGYVQACLADPDGGFFGSQSADAEYYALSSNEARQRAVRPAVDRTLYVGPASAMVSAYIQAGALLEDVALTEFALRTLERVVLATYRPGHGVAHCFDTVARVRGLLADHVQASAALVDAYEATGERPWIELAEELMHHCIRVMWDERHGGFFDRAPSVQDGGTIGLLRAPLKPVSTNALASRVLLRLADIDAIAPFHDRAMRALASVAHAYRAQGLAAAEYGRAIRALRLARAPRGR